MMELILLALYGLFALLLAIYTGGQGVLLWQYWRHRADAPQLPAYDDDDLPSVTIQLPVYNERYVVVRLLDAVTKLDYPPQRLHIQILDDSDDGTSHTIQQWCNHQRHLAITHLRRSQRAGYKAGALNAGLEQTASPFVVIFDADFVPPPDFLRQTVPYLLADEQLGVVQTRWGHLNRPQNALTRAQALSVDAHFIIEQAGRSQSSWPLPFNGTGGVWRVAAIHDAGGWSAETLTEDLDLSFRAQLRGWRSLFSPDVVVPGELPPQFAAYRQQQGRWAKGNAQNVRRLLRPVWQSNWPLAARLMATHHLLQYLPQPLMLGLLLLTPMLVLQDSLHRFPVAPLGIIGLIPPLMYLVSQRAIAPKQWHKRLLAFPALLLIGTGMIGHNSLAFASGLVQKGGVFERTPKFEYAWQHSAYALRTFQVLFVDVLLLLYTCWAIYITWAATALAALPYLIIYAASFATVIGWQLAERWRLGRVAVLLAKPARELRSSRRTPR